MLLGCDVNGRRVEARVRPSARLSDFLRDELGLTGTPVGCGEGVCGSCTVLVDGQAVRSCLLLALQCDGASIRTVEDVAEEPAFAAIRDAFLRYNALQCGFCTPGFVTTVAAVLADNAGERLSDAEVDDRLASVACRCTGYVPIVAAVRYLLGREG